MARLAILDEFVFQGDVLCLGDSFYLDFHHFTAWMNLCAFLEADSVIATSCHSVFDLSGCAPSIGGRLCF
jgi:hypothetical protein